MLDASGATLSTATLRSSSRLIAALLCALFVAAFVVRPRPPAPGPDRAEFDYRDQQDGRVVARIIAEAGPKKLTVEIRAFGPAVEPPRGYSGTAGENLQAARALSRGSIHAHTDAAGAQSLSVASRGRFRLRTYDPEGRLLNEGRTPEEMITGLRYTAHLTGEGPFVTEILVRGVPRLRIRARRGEILGFEPLYGSAPPMRGTEQGLQDKDIRRLIEALGDDDVKVRDAALTQIIAIGRQTIPELEKFRDDDDPERRARVQRAIRTIRIEEALDGANGKDIVARRAAFADLQKIVKGKFFAYLKARKDPRFIRPLTDIMVYELDPERRKKALDVLILMDPPAVYPAMIWAMRDAQGHAADPAATWLIAHGDETVLHVLQDRSDDIARRIMKGIRKRLPDAKPKKPEKWKPIDASAIARRIQSGKTDAHRALAIRAVVTGLYADPKSVAAVVKALRDTPEEVRFAAVEAFTHMAAVGDATPELKRLLASGREPTRIRQMAAVALARRKQVDPLLAAWKGARSELRITLASALADTGRKSARTALEKLLKTERDDRVRPHILGAIKRLQKAVR